MPEAPKAGLWTFLQKVMAVASVLVVPLIAWVIRLEVTMAVQTNDIERLQEDVSKISKVEDNVNANTVALASLTEKMNAADDKMTVIIGYMKDRRSRSKDP